MKTEPKVSCGSFVVLLVMLLSFLTLSAAADFASLLVIAGAFLIVALMAADTKGGDATR